MKKKVSEIKDVSYSVGNIIFVISEDEIERAIREKDFETKSFQGDLHELNIEWNKEAKNFEEYADRQRKFHIRKIANFIENGWEEPILLFRDGYTILDGLHRLKAAKYLNQEEVDVIVTDASPDLSDDVRQKLWAAITMHRSLEKALCEVGIRILKK